VYFDGCNEAIFYFILRDRWKNLWDHFGLSKRLKKTAVPTSQTSTLQLLTTQYFLLSHNH